MKKKKAVLIISLIIAFCISVCLLYKPIYYRLYLGDRIKGNIEVVIDDNVYSLEEDNIKLNDSGKIKINDDGTADISIHAGKYGSYRFDISDIPIERPVSINCFQHNWWNVQTFELRIKIDTSQNLVIYEGSYTTISNDGKTRYDTIDKIQSLTDEYTEILLGL